MSLQSAKKAVAILISAYRTPFGVHDATFAKLAAEALEGYSDGILQQLIDPKRGLIAKMKTMPSIADMVEFCQEYAESRIPATPRMVGPPPDRPSEPPEVRARVIAAFEELIADLANTGDPLQAWQAQMKPGQRSSVQDPDYIAFCEERRARRRATRKAAEQASSGSIG